MSRTLLVAILLASACDRPAPSDDVPPTSDTRAHLSDEAGDASVSVLPPEEPPPLSEPEPEPAPAPEVVAALEPAPEPEHSEAPRLSANMSWCGTASCDPVITFSHPVVPDLELDRSPPPRVHMDPAQPGEWRWIANNQLQFVSADDGFPHGSEVELAIDGLAPRGFDEDTLGRWEGHVWVPHFRVGYKVATWAVKPGKPRFVGFLNHFRMEVGRGPLFLLYDQPVEPDAIAAGLSLTDSAGRSLPADVSRPDDVRRAVPETVDLRHVVAVDLHYDPPRDSVITVRAPSAEGDDGPDGEADFVAWDVTVDDHVELEDWYTYDYEHGRVDAGEPVDLDTTLHLVLSDAVEPELLGKVDIQPSPEQMYPAGTAGYPALELRLTPGTRYTVRPTEEVIDALGNPVEPFEVRFRSRDLPPELEVPSLPITSERARPELEVRGRNLADLSITAYDFASGDDYAAALGRGHRERCADHGLRGKGQPIAPPTWGAELNHRAATTVALPGQPGLRCIEVRAASVGTESVGTMTRAVLVQTSDLGATAKVFEGGVMSWVTSLSDAAPVADATVHLVGSQGRRLAEGTTRLDGTVALTGVEDAHDHGVNEALFVVAQHGDDQVVLRLAEDRLSAPWRFALRGATDDVPPLNAALFTERGAYRPGDEVQVTLMAGPDHEGQQARLEVVDARGQQVTQVTRALDAYGVGSATVKLPSGAAVGQYTLRAHVDGRPTSRTFRVEEYRIPTFEVAVDAEQDWVRGEEAAAVIEAKYLHGGTLDGRPLQYSVTREPQPFELEQRVAGRDARTAIGDQCLRRPSFQCLGEALFELLGWQEPTIGAEVVSECGALSTRNMACNRVDGLDFATEARRGTGVDQGDFRLVECLLHVFGAQHERVVRRALEGPFAMLRRVQAQRQACGMPGLQTAIEHIHAIALAQPRQQPPGASGKGTGAVVIKHDIAVVVHAPELQPLDQRLRIRQRMTPGHALGDRSAQILEQISEGRTLDMPLRIAALAVVQVIKGRTTIKNHKPGLLLAFGQLLRADQLRDGHDGLLQTVKVAIAIRQSS